MKQLGEDDIRVQHILTADFQQHVPRAHPDAFRRRTGIDRRHDRRFEKADGGRAIAAPVLQLEAGRHHTEPSLGFLHRRAQCLDPALDPPLLQRGFEHAAKQDLRFHLEFCPLGIGGDGPLAHLHFGEPAVQRPLEALLRYQLLLQAIDVLLPDRYGSRDDCLA